MDVDPRILFKPLTDLGGLVGGLACWQHSGSRTSHEQAKLLINDFGVHRQVSVQRRG